MPTGNAFRWRDADAYLFDIDGTLLLSPDRTHRYALHQALLEVYGLETTIDGIAYHGKTDPGILRAAAERAGIAPGVIDQSMADALDVVRRDAAEKAERFRPNVLPGIRGRWLRNASQVGNVIIPVCVPSNTTPLPDDNSLSRAALGWADGASAPTRKPFPP